MRLGRPRAALTIPVLVLFAAAAGAQDVEQPPLAPAGPSEPTGPTGPAPQRRGGTASTDTVPRPGWMLQLQAEGAYESNVPFAPVVGQSDYVSLLTGRLAKVFGWRRGTFELGADGGATFYRTVTGLNRYTWSGDGTGQHRLGRYTIAKLQVRSAQAYARDDPRLTLTGALPPLVLARSDEALGSVSWRFARAWQATIEGRGERFHFSPQTQLTPTGTIVAADGTLLAPDGSPLSALTLHDGNAVTVR